MPKKWITCGRDIAQLADAGARTPPAAWLRCPRSAASPTSPPVPASSGTRRWRVSTWRSVTQRSPSRRQPKQAQRGAEVRPRQGGIGLGRALVQEMLHAAMADLVARWSRRTPGRRRASALRRAAPHGQEARDAGSALAAAGEPARHRRRDRKPASVLSLTRGRDPSRATTLRPGTSRRQAPCTGTETGRPDCWARVEQRAVVGRHQDHRHRPRCGSSGRRCR